MTPINTALCSFGMSGWVFHAPFINLNPGFNLYGVWERSKNLAQKKYPGVKTFRTLEEMLADEAVELVVVNTPNATHYEYARKALLAGKHVVVEKPFTIVAEEARELIALATRQNKKLSVYQNRRYDSDFKMLKTVVMENWLGDIVEVEMHFDRFKDELSPKAHKEVPAPGNGILYDLGSHLIDQALQLFGKPSTLFADIRVLRPFSQVDDYFEILFFYDKLTVRLKASLAVREALPGYVLNGLSGSFIKQRTDVQETLLQAGADPGNSDWGKEPETEMGLLHTKKNGVITREYVASPPGNYNEYYEGIFQAIRNNAPLPVTAAEGLQVIEMIEAAYKSNDTRCVVSL